MLLTEMPRVQVDIVKRIAAEAGDIDCYEAGDHGTLDDAIDATGARVVITSTGAVEPPSEYDELLFRHPRLRVLAIGGAGASILHELRPHRSLIRNISRAQLVETIRAAARAATEAV